MSTIREKADEIYSSGNAPDLEMQVDAFLNGYEYCQKEYKEKLRWIPVEEKLPEIDSDYPDFSVEVHVKNTEQSHVIAYYFFNEKRWCFDNNSIDNVTHWRYFL